MPTDPSSRSPWQDPIVRGLLGFFGVVFGVLVLPKAIKYIFRRFVLGTISEIVAIVVTGLLTEKAMGWLNKERRVD